jgi:hypothetical protein
MSCILTRCTYDKKFGDVQAISSGVIAHFSFSVLAPWWPSQESDRTEIWSLRVISPRDTYVQNFRPIDPAVAKRALLTDDNGQHVIVRAHT